MPEKYFTALCERHPVIGETGESCGAKFLLDYSGKLHTCKVGRPLESREDFFDVVHERTRRFLGDDVAEKTLRQLRRHPSVVTLHHHGVDFFATSIQSTLVYSLAGGTGSVIPVLACGGVPLNTSTNPQGLLIYRLLNADETISPLRVNLISNRLRRTMVEASPPITKEMIERCDKYLSARLREGILDRAISDTARSLLEEYGDPDVLSQPDYPSQATILNHRIHRRLRKGGDGPDMVFLGIERVCADLLRRDLARPGSLVNRVFLDDDLRQGVIRELDGTRGCWDTKALEQTTRRGQSSGSGGGSHFFWGIDPKGRRVALICEKGPNGELRLYGQDDRGNEHIVSFMPEALVEALERRQIFPSLYSCFLTISLARGIQCIGGCFQVEYLARMREKTALVLRQNGWEEDASIVGENDCDLFMDYLTGIFTENQEGGIFPAGPVEIITGGGLDKSQLAELGKMTLKQALMAGCAEAVLDVAPELRPQAEPQQTWKQNLIRQSLDQAATRAVFV